MKNEKDNKNKHKDSEEEKSGIDDSDEISNEKTLDDNSDIKVENYYEEDEIIPERDKAMHRLKKVVKVIDILEFVDSCLIVSERFLSDDEAKEIIYSIREKILCAEMLFTDYLITGKIPKIQ